MRGVVAGLLVCVAAAVGSGCALREREPKFPHTGGAERATEESLETYIERMRHLSSRPAARHDGLQRIEHEDKVLATALRRLAADPTAEHHWAVAERYRSLGVADLAYAYFNRAVGIDRRYAAAHNGLAKVWRDWGFPSLALKDAHRAIFYEPTSAAAQNTLGTILQALGQYAQARASYEQARTLDPGAVYAISNLCYLSFVQGDLESAARICESAVAIAPQFVAARNNLALTYAARGRLDLAQREFMKTGHEAHALFNIGIVHMATREYEQAAAAFDLASKANPSLAVARKRARQARQLHFGRIAARRASGDPK